MTEWAAILNLSLLMGALVAVTSGIIHGYTGFGAALFMTPLFAILFGPVEAIGVGSVIGFADRRNSIQVPPEMPCGVN